MEGQPLDMSVVADAFFAQMSSTMARFMFPVFLSMLALMVVTYTISWLTRMMGAVVRDEPIVTKPVKLVKVVQVVKSAPRSAASLSDVPAPCKPAVAVTPWDTWISIGAQLTIFGLLIMFLINNQWFGVLASLYVFSCMVGTKK